ncbi:SusD/RagB family nutrient-binding outer membrane lipoprotein [Chitinophaga sp. Cy-1792]|uniref:SusD/RagB family nutrient-binding outer membrane lipoprotein n=1 Tax=Chitinophaga sp. Cy-1792 TaxID=2608339 RepID=UPI001421A220|nr:SusD/RagB family nutrient-binding outer membrane lipoprotein [Chitinophaga sp. Cy-1792]NIG56381.1 SusD/RagB family nutrient-binding outer membrane lipoprotein [Chitinophaga sp. Cy-1792]
MKFSNKIWLYISGAAMMLGACSKDFQQINTTPFLPVTAATGPLVNGVISTMFLLGQEQAAVHNEWYYPATQLGSIAGSSGYLVQNGANDIWADYYNTLQNLNVIQDQINAYSGDKEEMNNIQAIVYVLRAYKTFRVTDQFGDMPYFNAGKSYSNNAAFFRPVYDGQEKIYDSLLVNLKWASEHIKTGNAVTAAGKPYASLGASETFFNNNMLLWQKFANSLLLRQAMQMVEKAPATATPYLQYALSGVPLVEDGEDVGMSPVKMVKVLTDSRFWAFTSHKFLRVSTTVWNMMATNTTTAGIFDPRALLFFETNQAGKWAPLGPGAGTDPSNPYTDKRDADISNKDNCIYSPFNYYLVRDINYQPEVMLSAAEVHFLKAEANARGLGVTKNMTTAGTEYTAGIKSSVNFWYNIAHNTNVTNDNWAAVAPPNPTDSAMNVLLTNPKVAFTGTDDQLLDKIYAQEWLSYFRQPWLAYNLMRRTGRTPRDGNPSQYVNFNRLQYPQTESIDNEANYKTQVAAMGGNSATVKVWWMK